MSRPLAKLRQFVRYATGAHVLPLSMVLACGCAAGPKAVDTPPPLQSVYASNRQPAPGNVSVTQASAVQLASATIQTQVDELPELFKNADWLSEEGFVKQVKLRNPTVAQMTAAIRAAATRAAQVTALDDPRLATSFGPASIGSSSVDFAYRLEISQALPFPGKLGLRGVSAEHETAAAEADRDDVLVQLTEAARNAFIDYFQASRARIINDEGLKLLREARDNAATRYKNGMGEQQDVLQADVAVARQRERSLTLERVQRTAQARINTLLHRAPDTELPQPPPRLPPAAPLQPVHELRARAVANRPDVTALKSRVAADEARVALAFKEYYPDFEVMAVYDTFWQRPEQDLRPMVGVRLNLPVQVGRRDAAAAEAQARVAQRNAELSRLTATISFQVHEAYEQILETGRSLNLYEKTAIPAAEENVRLARIAYSTGKAPFLNLIEAQRNLVELRERQLELITEARRRHAVLERVVGSDNAPAASTPSGTGPHG